MALNFQNFGSGEADNGRSRFFIFAGVLVTVLVSVSGGYVAWQKYFSQSARQLAAFNSYQKSIEDAYRNDTYGGATPEETLKLFIEALKKEDIELASKYFALDDNERNNTYLTYNEWKKALEIAKKDNRLGEIINMVSMAEYDSKSEVFNTVSFVVYSNDREILADIELWFNKLTKVWKIESL